MSNKSKHPAYEDMLPDLRLVRHSYAGQRAVKAQTVTYLPATPSMLLDNIAYGQEGYNAYQRYLLRAKFPSHVTDAVQTLVGMMWQRPPVIELPEQMKDFEQKATVHGESLMQLLRRIHVEQLIAGRIGLLVDFPDTLMSGQKFPYIATYQSEHITNWDDGKREQLPAQLLNFVTLDETEVERDPETFQWASQEKYRVLMLDGLNADEASRKYKFGSFRGAEFVASNMQEASWKGKSLSEIPFVFINTSDLLPEPDIIPLLPLAHLCMTIYRSDADYRQMLFMQGQDTLVIRGGEEGQTYRVGAGAVINVPIEGDAKFIGINSQGLSEQRLAIENAEKEAREKSGHLIDSSQRTRESGSAISTRMSAQTATLNTIAATAALGLQTSLRQVARWIGADESKVVVQPNLDFEGAALEPRTLVDLMSAKTMGAPLSLKSIHVLMQDRGMTKMDYDTEVSEVQSEESLIPVDETSVQPTAGNGSSTDPTGSKDPSQKATGKDKTAGQKRSDRASYRTSQKAAGRTP